MADFFSLFIPMFTMLFVVMDPIGNMPLFLALTASPREGYREQVAKRACLIGFFVLVVFAFVGERFLNAMGISLPAFRIAGGIMLFIVGLQMVFGEEHKEKSTEEPEAGTTDVAIFPLAVPLIAGPGTIASIILLMSSHNGDISSQMLIIFTLAVVLLANYGLFRAAAVLSRIVGQTVNTVISKIFGIVLGALSAQFIIDGVKSLL